MEEKLKSYGLNLIQVLALFFLLIIPSRVGNIVIYEYQLVQVNQNIGIFAVIMSLLFCYFMILFIFNERLISRLHDMVSLKYFVVIIVLFWICYDAYMTFIFQKIYFDYQGLITARGIVWRDVAVLPLDVQYSDLPAAYKLAVSFLRCLFLIVIGVRLIRGKPEPKLDITTRRKNLRKKTIEELKANVHPSVLKSIEKNDK